MQYTREDLKDLSNFLGGEIAALPGDGKHYSLPFEDSKTDFEYLRNFQKQLDVIKYNPLLFQTILEEYEVDFKVMDCPTDELVLHINHGGVVTKAICRWRFQKGV